MRRNESGVPSAKCPLSRRPPRKSGGTATPPRTLAHPRRWPRAVDGHARRGRPAGMAALAAEMVRRATVTSEADSSPTSPMMNASVAERRASSSRTNVPPFLASGPTDELLAWWLRFVSPGRPPVEAQASPAVAPDSSQRDRLSLRSPADRRPPTGRSRAEAEEGTSFHVGNRWRDSSGYRLQARCDTCDISRRRTRGRGRVVTTT